MKQIGLYFFVFLAQLSQAQEFPGSATEFKSAADAFQFSASEVKEGILLKWKINSCCKLYFDKIKIESAGVIIPRSSFVSHSAIFWDENQPEGYQRIAIGDFFIKTPKKNGRLDIYYQGCNTSGFCYPPQHAIIQGGAW